MFLDFIKDSKWQTLDEDTQDKVLNLVFDKKYTSDPQWEGLSSDDQFSARGLFIKKARNYEKSLLPEPPGFLGGLKHFVGRAGSVLTDVVPETIGRTIRGGDTSLKKSFLDEWIETNEREKEESKELSPGVRKQTWVNTPFGPITYAHLEDAPDSLGYSIANAFAAGGGAKAGGATGLAVSGGNPIVGAAGALIGAFLGGTAVSGRATKDQFLGDMQKKFLESVGGQVNEQTEQRWQEIREELNSDANWYGFWEAAPETVGNMLTFGIFKYGGKLTKPLFSKVKNNIAAKVGANAAKMAGVLSEEELTEALTTMKQSGIEAGHGLRERPLSYAESAKEVWPIVALTTPLLAGGGAAAARLTPRIAERKEMTPSEKITGMINEGMATGEVNGQSFTPDHAINLIKQGYVKDIFSDADISQFKERYPELTEGLAEDVSLVADIGEATSVDEAVASFEKATSGDEELSRVYGEARKRVGLLTPQDMAEKEFEAYSGPEIPADWQVIKEGEGVEVMARPQGLLQPKTAPNIFELQERVRQRRGQIVEAEKEYEGYVGPKLPSKPEVKMKEGPRTYPRSAEYVAGKPAPESLEIEHKPILTQRGQPWVTQNGAQTALKSQKRLLEKGITAKTHKVIPFKGGFAIEKKVVETAEAPKPTSVIEKLKEVSKKVKAQTLGMLKESDKVNDVTLGTLVDIAAEDPAKALEHAAEATVSKAKLIEGLKNKGLKAMGEAKSKEERAEIKRNLEETLRGIEGEKPKEPVTGVPAKQPWETGREEWELSNIDRIYELTKEIELAIKSYGAMGAEMVSQKIVDRQAKKIEKLSKEKAGYTDPKWLKKEHRKAIQQALKSGKLTPEKYAELHEKDYGPLAEFMPGIAEKKFVLREPVAGDIVYREGRIAGKWWSPDKEYVDSFGKGGQKHTGVIPKNIKLIDEIDLQKKMTEKERATTNPINAMYDKILDRIGYDGFISLEDTMEGTQYISYYIKDSSKLQPEAETKSRLLANIKSEKGSSELINDLARLGADAIKRGHKSFKAFSVEMEVFLGDAWAKVKHLMQEAYSAAKVVLKNERGAIDIRGPKAEFEDLGVWADDLIAKTLGEKPTTTKKERLFVHDTSSEPITEDDYMANRKDSKDIKLVARTGARRVISEIAEGVDKFLGSISTRLGQVSPKLKAKIRRLDFDINTKHAADVGKIHPLLLKAKKMKSSDYADWDYARKNSDVEKIQELVEKYDMQKEYAVYRQALDSLRSEGIDVGLAIGKIDEYAPRYLKDSKGFLTAIGKAEERPVYSDRLQERASELGISVAKMTQDMKAEIISNMILGGWSGLGGIPATKQRKLKKIPVYLNKYYMDSDAALMQHLYSMRKGVEARKFFGKIPKKVTEIRKRLHAVQAKYREISKHIREELPEKELEKLRKQRNKYIGLERQYSAYIAKYALQRDYTENIGSYVGELITNKEISPQHERIVNDILNARFHEAGTRGLIQAYKNLSYIDTMGSPISALTQIGDLAWALYEGGFIGTTKHALRALVGKSRITKEDVGITRIAQEFADSGKLGKAVTGVFKVVGLEKIDSIGKESLLNVAFEKYQKQAKDDPATLKRKISPIFENETDSVIEDLLNDEISENVKLLVHSRLLDFQPVALSETPQRYLDAGNGRLFYMLKTFTIKVFDVYRNEAYYKIKNGLKVGDNAEVKEGLKNLARLSMFFVLCNAGADELKDWVLGRKTDFSDRMIDNVLRLFGVSKFVTWKARTEGVGSALARQILPPFKFIDSAGKDIITAGDEKGLEVIGSIPVIGKLAYWHMGRGVSKREDLWNRRLRKHKSKLNEIKEGFEKAKDKDAFRRKHWKELAELRATGELQGKLNKRRKKINELKSKKELPTRKKFIQGLEKERTELIRDFLQRKGKRSVYADSIWAGVLGTTKEMDTIQSEVKRLVDTGLLTSSMKPTRRDIIGRMKKKIELTDEQYSQLVSDTERTERKRLERFVGREGWEDMTDERKVSIIKRSIAKARAKARKDLRREIMRTETTKQETIQ